jgi:hypothetical protein
MNTFTDQPASAQGAQIEGRFAAESMAGVQQSFAGAVSPVA